LSPAVDSRPSTAEANALASRLTRFGLWSLVAYTIIGVGLEGLHAFKLQVYLSASNETRRLMWTLGHAHGTLLGLIDLAIAGLLRSHALSSRHGSAVWWLLVGATITLPLGFFLGGIDFYSGDPGVGAALVPIGALALIGGLVVAAADLRAY
jgi:hypothetical protein